MNILCVCQLGITFCEVSVLCSFSSWIVCLSNDTFNWHVFLVGDTGFPKAIFMKYVMCPEPWVHSSSLPLFLLLPLWFVIFLLLVFFPFHVGFFIYTWLGSKVRDNTQCLSFWDPLNLLNVVIPTPVTFAANDKTYSPWWPKQLSSLPSSSSSAPLWTDTQTVPGAVVWTTPLWTLVCKHLCVVWACNTPANTQERCRPVMCFSILRSLDADFHNGCSVLHFY